MASLRHPTNSWLSITDSAIPRIGRRSKNVVWSLAWQTDHHRDNYSFLLQSPIRLLPAIIHLLISCDWTAMIRFPVTRNQLKFVRLKTCQSNPLNWKAPRESFPSDNALRIPNTPKTIKHEINHQSQAFSLQLSRSNQATQEFWERERKPDALWCRKHSSVFVLKNKQTLLIWCSCYRTSFSIIFPTSRLFQINIICNIIWFSVSSWVLVEFCLSSNFCIFCIFCCSSSGDESAELKLSFQLKY